MSTPVVSTCSLPQIPIPKIFLVVNFHHNIWGDQFVAYIPEDKVYTLIQIFIDFIDTFFKKYAIYIKTQILKA